MPLSRNVQIGMVVGGAVLLLHFYFQLIGKPIQRQITDLKSEQALLQSELPTYETQQEQIQKYETLYQERMKHYKELDESVQKLEEKLPSRKEMAVLLEQITDQFDPLGTEFVSVTPTLKKAEGEELFDVMEIETQFYADYDRAIEYLKQLESQKLFLNVEKLEMKLNEDESARPMVTVKFATYLGTHSKNQKTEVEKIKVETPKPVENSPFHPESKPYDNRLPGDHRLSMVIWKGGKPAALIDGKVMRPGERVENKSLDEITSNGVWFKDNGIKYFLPLEKS